MDDERMKRDLYEQITKDITQRFQSELSKYAQEIFEQKDEIRYLKERINKLEETIMWAAYNLNQNI